MEDGQKQNLIRAAIDTVSIDRVIVYVFGILLLASVWVYLHIATHPMVNEKAVEFVLPSIEKFAIFVLGALGGYLTAKNKD